MLFRGSYYYGSRVALVAVGSTSTTLEKAVDIVVIARSFHDRRRIVIISTITTAGEAATVVIAVAAILKLLVFLKGGCGHQLREVIFL